MLLYGISLRRTVPRPPSQIMDPSLGRARVNVNDNRGKRNEVRGKKIKIPLFSPHTSTLSPLVPLFPFSPLSPLLESLTENLDA